MVAARSEVGHLEGDLIIGARNASAMFTVFDRASRYCWLAYLPQGHDADATLAAFIEIVDRIPGPLRRSLTWDQDREMTRYFPKGTDPRSTRPTTSEWSNTVSTPCP